MPEPLSKLETVLWNLLEGYLEEGADELTPAESQRVGRLIRDTLEINDSPSSHDPGEIADFVVGNCLSESRTAAERWLRSLTEQEIARLQLGDVLSALAPGLERDIEELADENEAARGGE
jgi:hypothetical protein